MDQQLRRLRDLVYLLRFAVADLKGTLEKFLIPLPSTNYFFILPENYSSENRYLAGVSTSGRDFRR